MKRWHIMLVVAVIIIGLFFVDGGSVYVKQLLNRPPKATFTYRTPTRTLKYIAPTDRDLIMFLNNSTDPDGDPLTSRWYVRYNGTGDWKLLNGSRDHWGRLSVSNEKGHEIKLVVSDGMKEDAAAAILPFDPAHMYKTTELLGVSLKGINYHVGRRYMGDYGSTPTPDEINESLEVIRTELGCNAIKLYGDNLDVMIFSAEKAAEKGFQTIILSQRYSFTAPNQETTIDEHVKAVIEFSKKAEAFRIKHDDVILNIGEELQYTVSGLVDAPSYSERTQIYSKMNPEERAVVDKKLNAYLGQMLEGVRSNFLGPVTYSPNPMTKFAIKWQELGFDIVGPMGYYPDDGWNTESNIIKDLIRLKTYGKPVIITESGCECFVGADKGILYNNQEYYPEEQVKYLNRVMPAFMKARIDGIMHFTFIYKVADDADSYGLMLWNKNNYVRRGFSISFFVILPMSVAGEGVSVGVCGV